MRSCNEIDDFASLFLGRMEAYGGEEGESIKTPNWTYIGYRARVLEHLEGDAPMGVYPLIPDSVLGWVVRWGCVDFDEGDKTSFVHALNLAAVLGEFDVRGWIERSRSKGYHVWVFAKELVPAATMRRALLAGCQIAGAPTKEINPKSEGFYREDGRMNLGKFGNYVRLPYPNGATDRRVVIEHDGSVYTMEDFATTAYGTRATLEALETLCELYVKPTVNRPRKEWSTVDYDGDLPSDRYFSKRTSGLFRLGPFESRPDRSAALWRLAHLLREDGYSQTETVAFLKDADSRWGKFTARGDVERLHELVDKVYSVG